MNIKLIDSLIQVVRSLPEIEQRALVHQLNQLISKPAPETSSQEESIDDNAWEVWRSLGDDTVAEKSQNAAQQLAEMGGTQPDLKPIPRHQWGAFDFLHNEPDLYTLDDGEPISLNNH
jgi:hypothetical protein